MPSVQFRHIITHFFNAHCVAVHKPFDPISEEHRHDQSHEFIVSSTFVITGKSSSKQGFI